MKVSDILNEKPVESAWISDLLYNRPNRTLTMRLSNGKSFSIPNISRGMFDKWFNSPSKGRFFHEQIRDTYQVNRLK